MPGIENLITIGVVLLLLLFFRLIDSKLRSVNRAQKFISQWEKGLASYIEDKTTFIRNFGIEFEVEKKSAGELLRRIQTLTREELNQKVQALTAIDERIREYDTNLEELLQMTGRVQDNLNRLREESAYVENVEKKVREINEKFDSAEGEIDSLHDKLGAIHADFERENAAAIENAVEESVSAARAAIKDMEAETLTIGRRMEEHRETIERLERGRLEKLARDEGRIEKLLSEAVERAGSRAEKIEESAVLKLRDQAQERVNHIKTSFEEKIKTVQDTVKTKIIEINEQIKENREEWKNETASLDARQKEFTANWKKEINDLNAYAKQVKDEWAEIAHKTGQELIAAAEHRLEEYRQVQEEQYKQLASISNDVGHLEEELRRSMKDTVNRVSGDFARFGDEMRNSWESASGKYKADLQTLRQELSGLDGELRKAMQETADRVGGEFARFGDKMQNSWESETDKYKTDLQTLRRELSGLDGELRKAMQETVDRASGEFARIGDEMQNSWKAEANKIRNSWEAESGEYKEKLQALQQELAGIDQELQAIKEKSFDNVSKKLKGFEDEFLANLSRRSGEIDKQLEDWQKELDNRLDDEMDKISNDKNELIIAGMKTFKDEAAAIEKDIREGIRATEESAKAFSEQFAQDMEDTKKTMDIIRLEIAAQNNIAGQTGELKEELDEYIKDMKGTIDRIALIETEISRYDSQLAQIKRLEEEVNGKMTRFLSEKHRIEVLENDFTRLLQTSQSVDQKLAEVSNSDDLLQKMQLQLRHLEDAIKETEEKYQRVERKSKTLQETNDGIDRNFKALQENDLLVKRLDDTVSLLKTDLDSVRNSVESLSAENEKARDAAEKVSSLEDNIQWLEKRIEEMNIARESLARLATELQNLEKKAKDQVKLVQSVMTRGESQVSARKKGKADDEAPTQNVRENIKKLKAQGWTIDEIAKAYNMSKSEVTLTLEIHSKDV